jgi:hypothetical protein
VAEFGPGDVEYPPTTSTGLELASVNQDLALVLGKNYVLTFWNSFDNPNAGFVGVKFDRQPVHTVDTLDHLSLGRGILMQCL